MILYTNGRRLKGMVFLLFVLSALCCVGVYYFSMTGEEMEMGLAGVPLIHSYLWIYSKKMISLSWACGLFALLLCIAGLLGLRKILRGLPAATLAGVGLIIHPYNLVHWHGVREIELVALKGQKFLGIVLEAPEAYLATLSRWQRMMCRLNYFLCGAHLTLANLTVPLEEAQRQLNHFKRRQ